MVKPHLIRDIWIEWGLPELYCGMDSVKSKNEEN